MTLNDLIQKLSIFAKTYGEYEIATWVQNEIEDLSFILTKDEKWFLLQELLGEAGTGTEIKIQSLKQC